MSAQRLVQKGWYVASAGLLQTGHLAWMRTARRGADRSGGIIAHKNCAMSGARQYIPLRRPTHFGRRLSVEIVRLGVDQLAGRAVFLDVLDQVTSRRRE